MQLTIKGGEKRVKVTKPELKRLTNALEVLSGLAECGDEKAKAAHLAVSRVLAYAKNGDYGKFFGQKDLFEEKSDATQ